MAKWRVFRYWKVGASLVTYLVDTVDTFEDALQWASNHNLIPSKNAGRFLFKMEGHGKHIYNQKDYNYWYGRWGKQDKPDEPPEEVEPHPIPLPPHKEPEQKQQNLWDMTDVWIHKPKEKRRL